MLWYFFPESFYFKINIKKNHAMTDKKFNLNKEQK